jgi:enoyl-CoA hydratase/carnithine racemase
MNDVVMFTKLDCRNGKQVGVATLNKPKALNALSLDMINLLTPTLLEWQNDPNIAIVILQGEGDRAFCAGGDVVAMYRAMQANPNSVPDSLQDFFSREYQLDYLIHNFKKPLLVWGNGIVMGGGLGLMSGASHRIVTESARIAMPEITIGLYPDVGGSWFLNKMPDGCGEFLGLTGASINASDALYIKLADHFVATQQKTILIESIIQHNWQLNEKANHLALTQLCNQVAKSSVDMLPQGNVENHQTLLSPLANCKSAAETVQTILSFTSEHDKWLSKAQRSLSAGSGITMHLVFEQLQRAKHKSLAECFQMELIMSCRCGEFGEFLEGVRALLVDKDNDPKWRYASVQDVPTEVVESFFKSPWAEHQHPLKDLANQE